MRVNVYVYVRRIFIAFKLISSIHTIDIKTKILHTKQAHPCTLGLLNVYVYVRRIFIAYKLIIFSSRVKITKDSLVWDIVKTLLSLCISRGLLAGNNKFDA